MGTVSKAVTVGVPCPGLCNGYMAMVGGGGTESHH